MKVSTLLGTFATLTGAVSAVPNMPGVGKLSEIPLNTDLMHEVNEGGSTIIEAKNAEASAVIANTLGSLALGLVQEGLVAGFAAFTGISSPVDLSEASLNAIRNIINEALNSKWLQRDKEDAEALIDNASLWTRSADPDPSNDLDDITDYGDEANNLVTHLEAYSLQGSATYITMASLRIALLVERLHLRIEQDNYFNDTTDGPQTIRTAIKNAAKEYRDRMDWLKGQFNSVSHQLYRYNSYTTDTTCGIVCCHWKQRYRVQGRSKLGASFSTKWTSGECGSTGSCVSGGHNCGPKKTEARNKELQYESTWRNNNWNLFLTAEFNQIRSKMNQYANGNFS